MKNGRKAFIESLTQFAQTDDRVIIVIGDVGFSFMEPFQKQFPKQFLNTGVLEQSMMGIAVGLAREGFKPYVYTMRNFICFRPYEQVRNDIAFGNANVKLFGVAGSEAYKFLGYSHNVIASDGSDDEDVATMKRLPNMNVYVSQTEEEVGQKIKEEYQRSGPAYFII